MVELQNGCVCCGPQAGQLAPAVKTLCAQAEAKGAPFNQVRNASNFKDAIYVLILESMRCSNVRTSLL